MIILLSIRLQQLNLLLLMYIYELSNIMFLITCRQATLTAKSTSFFISQLDLEVTCYSRTSVNHDHYFYFNRILRLLNQLPVIDLSLATTSHHQTTTCKTSMRPFHCQFQLRPIMYFSLLMSLLLGMRLYWHNFGKKNQGIFRNNRLNSVRIRK